MDSGADDSCLVSQLSLPSEPLPTAKDVVALAGKLLGRVTHRTAPLSLLLSGNHHESISF